MFSLASPATHAQYPDKTITLVVPFPPGGVADTVARPVAEAMSRELKQPVVIDNKSGAGGAVGIGHAARAAADGYTLLLSLSSISILPEADKILDRKPLFQLDQFKPIARITADPTVLVVRADSPWRTLEDFIADARRKPAAYNYGSSGNYGTMHVPMEMLKSAADFRMIHIPYAGAGPAVIASARRTCRRDLQRPGERRAAHSRRAAARACALGRRAAGDPARRAEPQGAWIQRAVRSMVGVVRARVDAGPDHRKTARDAAQVDE